MGSIATISEFCTPRPARPSPGTPGDAGLGDVRTHCLWCKQPIAHPKPGRVFCTVRCRQAAFRLRRRMHLEAAAATLLRFAYADPPYPGRAQKFYGQQADFAGEVDHAALIDSLVSQFDGWALSTAADALAEILPLTPAETRVCAWVKPIGANSNTYGLHNCWEPVLVFPGRRMRPGVRDWLAAQPARKEGTLMGRKPTSFCAWLFQAMGMRPGDDLVDLFPGTGIVGRCWELLNAGTDLCKEGVSLEV